MITVSVYQIGTDGRGRWKIHRRIDDQSGFYQVKNYLGLEKKHGYKSGRMVKIERVYIIGYC